MTRLETLLALAVLAAPAGASALNVVTTTEGLASAVREVGGDRVRVESLSRGVQDPHFVDANPMLAVKLRNADLLVDVGLDLEIGWLPPLVNQSRNGEIQIPSMNVKRKVKPRFCQMILLKCVMIRQNWPIFKQGKLKCVLCPMHCR